MPQQLRFRNQLTMDISGSTTSSRKIVDKLGRGMILREMCLRLTGSTTYAAGANNVVATLNRGDEWGLLNEIKIVANGADPIRTFSGHHLRALNRFWFGSYPRMSTTLGDGATAAPTFDSSLIIPFWQPNSSYPLDTALDTRKVGDLRVELTTAAQSDINSANGPTSMSATVQIGTFESFGIDLDATDWNVYPQYATVAAANPKFTVDIPVTAAYRGFLINAAAGASATSADAASAINNIKIKSGTTTFFDLPGAMWRDWSRQRRGISRDLVQQVAATAPVTGAYLNGTRSSNFNEDAWYWVDLVQDGYMREAIDSLGFSELQLEFDIASACTLTIFPQQLFPIRGKR